jgi:hypothetical protein
MQCIQRCMAARTCACMQYSPLLPTRGQPTRPLRLCANDHPSIAVVNFIAVSTDRAVNQWSGWNSCACVRVWLSLRRGQSARCSGTGLPYVSLGHGRRASAPPTTCHRRPRSKGRRRAVWAVGLQQQQQQQVEVEVAPCRFEQPAHAKDARTMAPSAVADASRCVHVNVHV